MLMATLHESEQPAQYRLCSTIYSYLIKSAGESNGIGLCQLEPISRIHTLVYAFQSVFFFIRRHTPKNRLFHIIIRSSLFDRHYLTAALLFCPWRVKHTDVLLRVIFFFVLCSTILFSFCLLSELDFPVKRP